MEILILKRHPAPWLRC